MIISSNNIQKCLKNLTLRWDLVFNFQQQAKPFPDDVEWGSAVPELTRGATEVTGSTRGSRGARGSRQRPGTVWQLRQLMHTSAGNFWPGQGSKRRGGCDDGQWLRLPYLGGRQKHRHESPVKPGRKGQLSIQKINLGLADFQEEIRWRDAGGSVSRREIIQHMWDERED